MSAWKIYLAVVAAGLTLFAGWLFYDHWRTEKARERFAAAQKAEAVSEAKQYSAERSATATADWGPVISLLDDFGNGKLTGDDFSRRAGGKFTLTTYGGESPSEFIKYAATIISGRRTLEDARESARGFAKVARQKLEKAKGG